MAALVTANRWSAKLETHKTKEGPMLCTGIGCVGCFPELYKKQASVLGICDVDMPVYSLRPWLNEMKNNKTHKSKVKRTRKKKGKSKAKQEDEKAKQLSRDENKLATAKTETNPDFKERVDSKPTEDSALEIQNTSLDKAKELHSIDEQFIKETADYASDKEICTSSDVVSNVGEIIRPTVAAAVYDSMYIGRDRNIALSLQDDCLPSRSFSVRDDTKQIVHPNGEDAVCFFFVLEYYRSARVLPVFKVMEIVESLNETVDLADIKCVQRVNGCWRIVLRSKKYTNILRECGIRIRGRMYEVIDDTDSYFDVLY